MHIFDKRTNPFPPPEKNFPDSMRYMRLFHHEVWRKHRKTAKKENYIEIITNKLQKLETIVLHHHQNIEKFI